MLVDFLGRYESLPADFAWVCRRLGIEAQLTRRNRSRHDDYRRYYDQSTKAFVAEHWQRDIDLLDYTFDGSPEASQAAGASRLADEPIRRAA